MTIFRHGRHSLAAACFIVLLSAEARSATITVTNTDNSGAGSLRQAVADANDADTINFGGSVTGTITLTSEIAIGTILTMQGPGSDVLTISGNDNVRIFSVTSAGLYIHDLTFTQGKGPAGGGGAALVSGDATFTRCTFNNNQSLVGGGAISVSGGSVVLEECTVSSNSALGGGGAVLVSDGSSSASFTARNCTFSDNHVTNAGYGGGDLQLRRGPRHRPVHVLGQLRRHMRRRDRTAAHLR
jgi:predicted outer membrane repeat protein